MGPGGAVAESVSLLMIEFLSWVSGRPRTYAETMDAWRSHCPRQTIWEDAQIEGLVRLEGGGNTNERRVVLTDQGRALLNGKA